MFLVNCCMLHYIWKKNKAKFQQQFPLHLLDQSNKFIFPSLRGAQQKTSSLKRPGLIYSTEISRCCTKDISLCTEDINKTTFHFTEEWNRKRNYDNVNVCSPLYLILSTECMTEYHQYERMEREERNESEKIQHFVLSSELLKLFSRLCHTFWIANEDT